ncbi:MAG: porin [Polaromonas sp.]|nr:porin [Polaromonas sp.]
MTFTKNCLAAAIALTCASSAWSQTAQIYGILDTSLQSYRPPAGSVVRVNSGDLQTSRLGFNISEDLGNGNKVNAQLLGGLGMDTGTWGSATALFNLGSSLGMSGNWGSFDLGFLRNPMIFPVFAADQTGYGIPNYGVVNQLQHQNVLGTGIGGFYTNSIRYRTPVISGLKAEITKSNGDENATPNTFHDKAFNAFNVMYNNGPLFLSVAATHSKVETAATNFTVKGTLLAGSYKFSALSVGGDWTKSSRPGLDQTSWVLTSKIPVTQTSGEVDLAYGRLNETGGKTTYAASVGYTYHFSKRTDFYTYAIKMGNNSVATRGMHYFGTAIVAAGAGSSAFAAGMRHAF